MGSVMQWDDMPPPGGNGPVSPPVSAALATLQAACETGAPASLMAAHMALSCAGRLRAASPEGVVLELPHPPTEPILPGAACAVSFPLAGRSAGFTGRATAVDEEPDGALLVTLEVPARIQRNDQRVSVRVPVPNGTLSAAILRGESLQPVRAIDISLHGILLEYREGEVPDLDEGHRRMVALKLDSKMVVLEAEVRRREGPRYGMFFIVRDRPPRDLVKIVGELQHRWSATSPADEEATR